MGGGEQQIEVQNYLAVDDLNVTQPFCRSDLEDASEKATSLKTSLEAAYKEIAELKRGLVEKEGEAREMALSKEMAAKQVLK